MTHTSTIARPYAKAAFEAANLAHQLPLWSAVLKNLSLMTQEKTVHTILKNPHYTQKQLAELFGDFLQAILRDQPSSTQNSAIENFIRVLAEKKRLNILPAISQLFDSDCAKASGHLSLTVTSAFPLDDHQKKDTQEKLSRQFNSALQIHFEVDENLMGGLVIRSDNWVMDDSIKGKLAKLKSVLI